LGRGGENLMGEEMSEHSWVNEFPGAITVCDADGIILEMNDQAAKSFAKEGGRTVIGKSLLDCHPEPARTKTKRLLENQQKNVYTIEKNGVKKLVFQSPWYRDGKFAGLVELVLEIPFEMPHFVRTPRPKT
jgi:transcriptional regulator with PAS, ATPase and Fis domain